MLVLSRKESQRIVFPTVGIAMEVIRVQGKATRIGIDAPDEIPIFRGEVADLKGIEFSSDTDPKDQLRRLARAVRERLDAAAVSLNQLHQHCENDPNPRIREMILDVFRELKQLDAEADAAVETDADREAHALLIGTDAHERGLLASYLRLRGIETTIATGSHDALDFLSLHAAPDVILLDMQAADHGGRYLVENIRAEEQPCKLFAMSRTDPSRFGVPSGPQGIDHWFPKPVDPEQVVLKIAAEAGFSAAAL
jgi:carbon storage regulator CsrA